MSKFGNRLAQALEAQQNKVFFIEIPWAGHAFDAVFQGLSNQFALYYTERFLAWALLSLNCQILPLQILKHLQ